MGVDKELLDSLTKKYTGRLSGYKGHRRYNNDKKDNIYNVISLNGWVVVLQSKKR